MELNINSDDFEQFIEQSMVNDDDNDIQIDDECDVHDSGFGGHSFSHRRSLNDNSINTGANNSVGTSRNQSSTVNDIFYCENYFDLDDIISQTLPVNVRFLRTIPNLGFLDPQSNQGDDQQAIIKGTKLELPLWIVKELNNDRVVNITIPKGYNQNYREILGADAGCVNLHKLSPNYYLSGKHLTSLNLAESEDIAQSLLDTFANRFPRIVNFALSGSNNISADSSSKNSISQMDSMIKSNNKQNKLKDYAKRASTINDDTINDLNQFKSQLDNWERKIYDIGADTALQIKQWENRDLLKVRPNEMVINLKKRKVLYKQHENITGNKTEIDKKNEESTEDTPIN